MQNKTSSNIGYPPEIQREKANSAKKPEIKKLVQPRTWRRPSSIVYSRPKPNKKEEEIPFEELCPIVISNSQHKHSFNPIEKFKKETLPPITQLNTNKENIQPIDETHFAVLALLKLRRAPSEVPDYRKDIPKKKSSKKRSKEDLELMETEEYKEMKKIRHTLTPALFKRTSQVQKCEFTTFQYPRNLNSYREGDEVLYFSKNSIPMNEILGRTPSNRDYDFLIKRRNKGHFVSLYDVDSKKLMVRVYYRFIEGEDVEKTWQICEKISGTYKGGIRSGASGFSLDRKATFTFGKFNNFTIQFEGYTNCYGVRKPEVIQEPEALEGGGKISMKNGDWKSIGEVAQELWKELETKYPEYCNEALKTTSSIAERKLVIKNTPYTACTLNVGFNTKFHKDLSDNDAIFSETLVMWEKEARPAPENEGFVVIPEYRIAFQLGHGDVYLMKGRLCIHGVTPSTEKRTSLVLYSHKHI